MHLSTLVVSTLGLLGSGTAAHPVAAAYDVDIESRQSTSLSIIRSAGYDLDVAVEATDVVQKAEKSQQTGSGAVTDIKPVLAELKKVFTTTAWAVEGDLTDALKIISYEEKNMVISQVDKIKAIARKIVTTLTKVASLKSQEAEVLALSESKAFQPYVLAMLESIAAFVNQSKDDLDASGLTEETQDYIKDAENAIKWPGVPRPPLV